MSSLKVSGPKAEVELEENFDVHFNRKKLEIQNKIFRKKEQKEKVNQQISKPPTTTAYEPIIPSFQTEAETKEKESEKKVAEADQDYDSSSSGSDSSDEENEAYNWQGRGDMKVVPHIGDELNHAKCIKDLSFYKLNWEDEDLEVFHRPNIQSAFLSN